MCKMSAKMLLTLSFLVYRVASMSVRKSLCENGLSTDIQVQEHFLRKKTTFTPSLKVMVQVIVDYGIKLLSFRDF